MAANVDGAANARDHASHPKAPDNAGRHADRGGGSQSRRDPARPLATIPLHFRPDKHGFQPLREDISALALNGRTLFCAGDETAAVERLILDEGGAFGAHESFDLHRWFDLPGKGKKGEMDIEGLALAGGYLWITGSHSLKRDKPGEDDRDLHDLHDVGWDPNRGFLGRIPLADRGDGVLELVAPDRARDADSDRRAACLEMDDKGRTIIRRMLGREPLLKSFMDVPAKENGFDVEGLAVIGERLFLGLRGPVLAGRALMIEMRLKETKSGHLKPARIDGKRRYKLHALDLGGLGIRDILFDGKRLLILGGVTMSLSGPQAVFVLDQVPEEATPIPASALKRALELPVIPDGDHAEGIAILDQSGERRLLVVYDSPDPARLSQDGTSLDADLFPVP